MDNLDSLIKKAKEYIKEQNTLVEIKEFSKWRQQGIIKSFKRVAESPFPHDKEIEFMDGAKVIVNL